jgi:phosphatidylglycerol:prolipoprotein diacylglycerol transferase
MKNELLHIGPITVYGYGLMIAIGVIAAYLTAEFRAKRKQLDHEKIFNLTIWCAVGGFAGARLLYYITIFNDLIKDPKLLISSDGLVVFGGIICGIFAGYLFCKRNKLNFLEYFDLVMPSIALAQGFGRLGCLFAGCCYGVETDSIIGITFQHSHYAINNVSLVPTQLISSGLNFLHFFVLILIAKRIKVHGVIAGCYLMFYSAGRFILEFFRGDLERGNVGSISTSQFIAIFTFLFGVAVVVVQLKRNANKATVIEKPQGIFAEDEDQVEQEEEESQE